MSLQLILGGAGSGKTRLLYDTVIKMSMEQPDTMYLVITPEQFTMQTQKEIVRLHPRKGIMNIDVLSFKRLAYRVFEDLGVQIPSVLDDMGKSMVLRKVAAMKRSSLSLYKGHLEQSGFINQLKSQISELYQYGVTPETLGQAVGQADTPLLSQKLEDLQVIYQGFRDYIEDHYITAEEILDILCRELPKWEPLKNSVIFMDGFTGLTPVQYRLAELFLIHAREVLFTVTLDPREPARKESSIQHLFYLSRHTVCRLVSMAKEHGVFQREDMVCSGRPAWRFQSSPDLDFMEQNLYRYYGKSWESAPEHIRVYRGRNPAGEAAYVCSQMEQLVRQKGMRYRDMAVITGDLPVYSGVLCRQFDEAGIPYFLDDKKSILENPMVELLRSALEIVKDFSYESVFRYLKTGMVYERTSSRKEMEQKTDRLENYVRALGIRGWKRWECQWERQYRGSERLNLEELNEYRQWILEPLRPLREAFGQEDATISSVTAALRQFLERMELKEKLEDYEEFFLNRGQPGDENLAREYGQVYDRVLELLTRLEGLLGEEKADRKNYIQILDAGFEEIRVGVIPATADQVMVGDITRSRLESVKVLFFVGVNEGRVPQRKNGGSLLTDRDRAALRTMDIELAPTSREDGCIQKFYLYMMMAKPSDCLVLTYAALNPDGKSQRPSSLLGEIEKLFPGIETLDEEAVEWPIQTIADAKECLIRELKKIQGKDDQGEAGMLELLSYFLSDSRYRSQAEALVEAAFYCYQERGIGRAAARALYGPRLQGSVTRLEQFASCAYAHFLKYGLELMQRQEYELEAVDMGNLFHQSIDRCFASMKEEGRDWRQLTDEERKKLVKESVAQVTAEYGNTIMASSARNAYLAGRVERMTDRTIWALAEQVKKGDFEPAGFEVSFSAIDNLKAMRIRLSEDEELQLKGRIDRLDLCRDEDYVYVKIIDYKSGSTSFDLAALYYGLQLQLVVYMDAALEMEERKNPGCQAVPAGIFYYHIADPLADGQKGTDPEEIERQILRQLRMNGLVNSDLEVIRRLDREIEKESDVIPVAMKDGYVQESRSSVADTARFSAMRRFVGRKLRESGQQILGGKIDLKPYKEGNRSACDYCPYHAVCGFDTKTAGFGYRRLKSLSTEEIWEKMEMEGEREEHGSEMDGKAERSH